MTTPPRPPMDEPAVSDLSPVKRALLEIRSLKARLAAAEGGAREPLAIVGMGLRLPGGIRDLDGLAAALRDGRDAIGDIPPERWSLDAYYDADPDAPGKMTTRFGGFLTDIDGFDADFFGIAPREADAMDPQQRMLLEIAWEALENAGQSPRALAGSRTGVFLGISNSDYWRATFSRESQIDAYAASGGAFSVAAGRLSYVLGLNGPSIAVDTACSSSLTALHLAGQSLNARECDLAIVAGVNLVLTPHANIGFSKARMMAPDGRCKAFDARADGYVRSEGCVVAIVQRRSDARRAARTIHAIVRGSALNQDGRSGGLTAPSGPAQEAVVRAALQAAGVAPGAVGFVEAHGTGTALGDPIEMGALAAVFGPGRDPGHPLRVGSIKSNVGHLEAAAGLAGVAKVVAMLREREVFPNLHFETPSPHVDWHAAPFEVPTVRSTWTAGAGPRIAGVSSFGFSGTNAHVIIEEADVEVPAPADPGERPLHVLVLSARSHDALVRLAGRHAAALHDDASAADVAFTAGTGRAHFRHRLAIVGPDVATFVQALNRFADTAVNSGPASSAPRVGFLFTGFGSQQIGMARVLAATSRVFAEAIGRCAAAFAPHLDRPLTDLLADDPELASRLDDPRHGQPAVFAVEYALAQLWRSWGVEPAVVLGHSLGEYAAAVTAGVLDLDAAAAMVAARGRLCDSQALEGGMLSVFAPQAAIRAALGELAGTVPVAAFNGPTNHVLSGTVAAIESARQRLADCGIETKAVHLRHAFHSPAIDPLLGPFESTLRTLSFAPAEMPIVSSLLGRLVGPGEIERVDYWTRHLREPVRFQQAVEAMAGLGITHCVEIGPHAVLSALGAECLPDSSIEWLPSLRRGRNDWAEILDSVCRLYVGGVDIDWAGFDSGRVRRRVGLPVYPFEHRRYWSAAALPQASDAIDPSRLRAAIDRHAECGPLDLDVRAFPGRWEALDRLVREIAASTLAECGVFGAAGERHDLAGVLRAAGIAPGYRHLVGRWLAALAGAGRLQREGVHWIADRPLRAEALAERWADVDARMADDLPLLQYLHHCATLVTGVLTGRTSPLETLFPGGSDELARTLYASAAGMRYVNGLAAATLREIAAGGSTDRTLRVLEIGAGTGGTTSALLPVLDPARTRYTFSDLSDLFLDRGRDHFGAYPFVDYRRFDLDADAASQGFAPGSFDVIVAANAVHAVRDLQAALRRLVDLLAPGGVLMLVESTRYLSWFDVSTGLIEGWQHFDDAIRESTPLMDPPAWQAALVEAGFVDADVWPRADRPAAAIGQSLVVGRKAGRLTMGAGLSPLAADRNALAVPEPVLAEPVASFRVRLEAALPMERAELLCGFVRNQAMAVLGREATDPIGLDDRLMALGFDSLMAVQLRGLIGRALGFERALPATLMFDHPTIAAIARYLEGRLADGSPLAAPVPATPAAPPASAPAAAAPPPDDRRAAEVARMSDAEIEALLLARVNTR
jgi:acyl transferase domain-containing protein/SAM-dependent methyltransferase